MAIAINSDVLETFCKLHYDENGESFENVSSAVVEFDWLESRKNPDNIEDVNHKEQVNILKKMRSIKTEFIGNKETPKFIYEKGTIRRPTLDNVGKSSNIDLVSKMICYLGETNKKTLIVAASGCESSAVYTYQQVQAKNSSGSNLESIAKDWALAILHSPFTETVSGLYNILKKYDNFTIITPNVTRSFELKGINKDKIIRSMDNKIDWISKENHSVNIKIGSIIPMGFEIFNQELRTKKPEVVMFLGYGFRGYQETSYLNNFPFASIVIFDKNDKEIEDFKTNRLDNEEYNRPGTGYVKVIDNLERLFLDLRI